MNSSSETCSSLRKGEVACGAAPDVCERKAAEGVRGVRRGDGAACCGREKGDCGTVALTKGLAGVFSPNRLGDGGRAGAKRLGWDGVSAPAVARAETVLPGCASAEERGGRKPLAGGAAGAGVDSVLGKAENRPWRGDEGAACSGVLDVAEEPSAALLWLPEGVLFSVFDRKVGGWDITTPARPGSPPLHQPRHAGFQDLRGS